MAMWQASFTYGEAVGNSRVVNMGAAESVVFKPAGGDNRRDISCSACACQFEGVAARWDVQAGPTGEHGLGFGPGKCDTATLDVVYRSGWPLSKPVQIRPAPTNFKVTESGTLHE